jgi:Domain of unknown function (DUF4259)
MGAWGAGIYENDDACDFAGEVAEGSDLSRVEEALDGVLNVGDDYLEAPEASQGLAAADVVARLRGQRGDRDGSAGTIEKWIQRTKPALSDELVQKAGQVVVRVRTEPSELLELWSEGDPSEWLGVLDALTQRLS